GERAAGREWHDQMHWPRRIGLRVRDPRYSRQRGSASCQMQEFAAGKFHFEPPSRFTSLDHFVGGDEQLVGHSEAEHSGGLVVDDQLELAGLYDWQVRRLRALEDATGIDADLTIHIHNVASVGH